MADTIAQLRARLTDAEDEIYRVEQADDYAHISGRYERAVRARDAARKALEQELAKQGEKETA